MANTIDRAALLREIDQAKAEFARDGEGLKASAPFVKSEFPVVIKVKVD